jgi:hypothetical protein
MAEHSADATGKHCSHPPSLNGQPRMPDGIYPAMNPVKSPGSGSSPYRVIAQARVPKLAD